VGRQVKSGFKFDSVFGSFTTQEEIFEQTLAPVIGDVLSGFESTVFAYGQTGTGKTHTMEGDIESEEHMGIIPRAACAIFEALAADSIVESHVQVSYLEIYNEELTDLLLPEGAKAKLMVAEDNAKGGKGVHCHGLSEATVGSPKDVLTRLQTAQERRRVGETKMNKQSSRSHCLFTLTVRSKELLPDGMLMERVGKLHMCDLAGSECAKTAGSKGEDASRERERKNINQSLLTLGRVISALRDGSGRVPYRDSKLTRLLQESLGGRCKTCIIATVSPSILCADETLSTLSYAQRAHGIQNKPVQSVLMCTAAMPAAGEGGRRASGSGADSGAQSWQEMVRFPQQIDFAWHFRMGTQGA
jgi:kinesin family protein 11